MRIAYNIIPPLEPYENIMRYLVFIFSSEYYCLLANSLHYTCMMIIFFPPRSTKNIIIILQYSRYIKQSFSGEYQLLFSAIAF